MANLSSLLTWIAFSVIIGVAGSTYLLLPITAVKIKNKFRKPKTRYICIKHLHKLKTGEMAFIHGRHCDDCKKELTDK